MCAWWAGQPAYGSNPTSKFVRENLEYLKTLTDLLANSGVSLVDLTLLHTFGFPTTYANPATEDPGHLHTTRMHMGFFNPLFGNAMQAVTGVGFTPAMLLFLMESEGGASPGANCISVGFDAAGNKGCIRIAGLSPTYASSSAYSLWNETWAAHVHSMDADGFTITRDSVSSNPVMNVHYLAIR